MNLNNTSKSFKIVLVFLVAFFALNGAGYAHFGMVIPSDNMVMPEDERTINIRLSFSHPFEMIGMDLKKPADFRAVHDGSSMPLTDRLSPARIMGFPGWQVDYAVKRPGAHIFVMEPVPYWEPAEDAFIIHYTKTVVAAFGDDAGWDTELGLKTEIVPLSKPFGLYSQNMFQGIVKSGGKAVPYAEVEVEFYNEKKNVQAPTDYMITQTIKADQNGVFSYAVPSAGWWGFAALTTAEETMDYQGKAKPVEQGAVIWVRFEPWQEK